MKMPNRIPSSYFAPCGMNCMVCYKHCNAKKPCGGCLPGDENKPNHCRKCKIKSCIQEKNKTYCFECPDFPCRLIHSLEKSYLTRYKESLICNSEQVKSKGLDEFLFVQTQQWACLHCGGIISLHDGECSECHKPKTTTD